jgi:hypothetical protein
MGPPTLALACPVSLSGGSDEDEVSFVELSWDDRVVALGLGLSLVFIEGLQGEGAVSVDEVF